MNPIEDPLRIDLLQRLDAFRPDPELDRRIDTARTYLGVDVAVLQVIDASAQHAVSVAGHAGRLTSGDVVPLRNTFCAQVVHEGRPRIIHDARQLPDAHMLDAVRRGGISAYIGVPVRVAGRIVGVLCAMSRTPRFWTDGEQGVLEQTALGIAHYLETRDRNP